LELHPFPRAPHKPAPFSIKTPLELPTWSTYPLSAEQEGCRRVLDIDNWLRSSRSVTMERHGERTQRVESRGSSEQLTHIEGDPAR
jgi:hypothetical protein